MSRNPECASCHFACNWQLFFSPRFIANGRFASTENGSTALAPPGITRRLLNVSAEMGLYVLAYSFRRGGYPVSLVRENGEGDETGGGMRPQSLFTGLYGVTGTA